ncbi:rod shape-determining protein MreD [Syntrophobotulus glycolicus DSM 8271]|uniref:Rod shape-determining protein MreD n=2 Tax=Syntrophobotulus TaxID=51196 RepID=F0SVI2_SYNGF|nr:rod shape-determining protein MreD [Syntrophobotulus glycolicus DSM 8271]
MRYFLMAGILVLCLIFPGTLFYYLSWDGIKPDLAMLWLIYLALHHRTSEGVILAAVTGLIVDLYLGRYLGLYVFTFIVLALGSSYFQKRWYRDNIPLTTVLVFCLSLIGQALIAFLTSAAGLNWSLGYTARLIILISLYNALLVPITYPPVHRSFTAGWLKKRSKYDLY